jgi:hypothetical protein
MRVRFSLLAGCLLACGVLFLTTCAEDSWGSQNKDVRPNGRGDRIRGTPPKASAGAVTTGNGIDYHNGPVLHTINAYYIWYGNWNGQDPTGPPILTDFISNIGGSSYFDINTTYGDPTGDVASWDSFTAHYGSGDGQFNDPNAISVDAAGRIYAMDTGNSRLVRIDDMNGTNWTVATTGIGSGVGQFAQYSTEVAFDTFGSIYVADTGNRRIVRMDDLAGNGWTTLTQSPPVGIYIYSFASPVGVALDTAGRIYVADASTPTASAIRVDDMSGSNWTSVSLGSGATPHSIAVDSGAWCWSEAAACKSSTI